MKKRVYLLILSLIFSLQTAGVSYAYGEDAAEKQVFSDDFSGYEQKSYKRQNQKLNENWSSFANRMGYDQQARFGISDNAKTLTSSYSNLLIKNLGGNFIFVEARNEDLWYSSTPCVIYNGKYPDTQGYTVKVELYEGSSQRTGGTPLSTAIRFMVSDDQESYYQLQFVGQNQNSEHYNVVLVKKTGSKIETLYSEKSTSDIIKATTKYILTVSAYNGCIKYKIAPKSGSGFTKTGSYTDTKNPLRSGRVALGASGSGAQYVIFDNFSVSSYDPFTEDGIEPDNVFYEELTDGKTGDITLESPKRIRKIVGLPNQTVKVSQNGSDFTEYTLSSEGNFINTTSDKEYKYIKLDAPCEIYTDADKYAYIRQNTKKKYTARFGGNELLGITSSNAALSAENGMINASGSYNGNIRLTAENENLSFEQIYRIERPIAHEISKGKLKVRLYLAESVEKPSAVVRFFDKTGRLINTVTTECEKDGTTLDFSVKYNPNAAKTSVMIMSGSGGAGKPVCEYEL